MTAPRQTHTLKVATAFSGGFGSVEFSLKYENTPHEVIFAIEWMKPQRECYTLNHGTPRDGIYEDIVQFYGKKYKGEIDLFHLSPPCQSFSMAGKREGLDSDKGNLMFEALRAIDEVQPKMFTVENVASLTSSNGGEDWNEILKAFRSLPGYTISYGKMNAKHYNGIQNRDRLFIVGFRATCVEMSFPSRVERQYRLADFLEDDVDEKYYLSEKMIKGFIKKMDEGSPFKLKPLTRESLYSPTITARYHKCAITDPFLKEELKQVGGIGGEVAQKHNSAWARVYDIDGIAPTQVANGGGGGAKTGLFLVPIDVKRWYTRPYRIRKLTPREAARVMGDYDDLYKMDGFSDTKKYEFIGNAIEINTYRHLLGQILKHANTLIWNEPQEPSFAHSATKQTQTTLF